MRPVAYITLPVSTVLPSFSVTFRLRPALVDGRDLGVAHDVDAALEEFLGEAVAQLLVEAAQDLGAAVEERRVDAEAVEDAGELHGDVAAADDQDGFRQAVEMERLIGGDGVAHARHLGHYGRPPVATRMVFAVILRLPG